MNRGGDQNDQSTDNLGNPTLQEEKFNNDVSCFKNGLSPMGAGKSTFSNSNYMIDRQDNNSIDYKLQLQNL